jgi:hypothetical protein
MLKRMPNKNLRNYWTPLAFSTYRDACNFIRVIGKNYSVKITGVESLAIWMFGWM